MITIENLRALHRVLSARVSSDQHIIKFNDELQDFLQWVDAITHYHSGRMADLEVLCNIVEDCKKREEARIKESGARIIFMYPDYPSG